VADASAEGQVLVCQAASSPHGKAVVIGVEITSPLYGLSAGFGPSAYGAQLHCAASGQTQEAFKYKKGERLKRLKSLNPKCQFRTVNRHDWSVKRQKVLALLSFFCHTSVCLLTEMEYEYDG
jgi:hypothetical protein